jgi:UDP-glucose 4-epimerase
MNKAINIGTGNGMPVFQMVSEFEQQSIKKVNYQIASCRPGDAVEVWADVSKAARMLGFQAKFGATEMCRDTWHWQSAKPNGYEDK